MSICSASKIKTLLENAPEDCFIVFRLDGKKTIFEAFKSSKRFHKYNLSLKPRRRNYYETVLKDIPQKARFDIDIKRNRVTSVDPIAVINDLIYAIMDVAAFYDINITFDDILLYSSNGPEKYSYHLIIDHWYHDNHHEARAFYDLVISSMSNRYTEYIDDSVYKSLQQFRIIENTKAGDNRPKVRVTEWKYHDADIVWELDSPYGEFLKSLLTHTSYCSHLNIEFENRNNEPTRASDSVELTKIAHLIPEGFEADTFTKHGYKLRRTHPSKCLVCNRIHEHENAYIKILDGSVIYKCFRNLAERYVLDVIDKPKSEVKKKETLLSMTEAMLVHINGNSSNDYTPTGASLITNTSLTTITDRLVQKRLGKCK